MRDQDSPEFWKRVEEKLKAKKAAYKREYFKTHPKAREWVNKYNASWRLRRRQDPDYLLRDREIRAAAMCRFRAKKKADA